MVVYNFKKIAAVPSAGDFIDIVLTRTQRKTPTVIHPGYKISRIRSFYMRKVKFTQQTINERLGLMLQDFPRLNDIHPFYADLMNILYDRDHYKLALGQVNTAKGLIDSLSRDYIRLLKYGDSLYRCKQLKRAALGRMMTILKRQKAAFAYLEEVRKHLSRLPALDPHTRSLLVTGFPNVGKSSFMNKVTRANVDVQPYAFTTKSLYVGHMDHRYLRWQVIDTPGILDHPLEERNTIEMQAITALAHLQCAVLYFIDISENCGYTIDQQCSLFASIKPLFANKQLILVVNKIDVQPWETLEAGKKSMIESMAETSNCTIMCMSNVTETNVSEVKNAACDKLLAARVDSRIGSKKVDDVMNRLQVFQPSARDGRVREAFIPESVQIARANGTGRQKDDHKPMRSNHGYAVTKNNVDNFDAVPAGYKKTERDLMWENGGNGAYSNDYRKSYLLNNDDYKFDIIPEIIEGKNIADFVDPEIEAKLVALEAEEEQLVAEDDAMKLGLEEESDLDSEEEAAVQAIREKKTTMREISRANRSSAILPRTVRGRTKDKHDKGVLKSMKDNLEEMGVDSSHIDDSKREFAQRGRKRTRRGEEEKGNEMDDSEDEKERGEEEERMRGMSKGAVKRFKKEKKDKVKREESLARSHSKGPKEPSERGLKDEDMAKVAQKKDIQGRFGWEGGKGEGDHTKNVHLVKWMNTGKKRNGTHYCR